MACPYRVFGGSCPNPVIEEYCAEHQGIWDDYWKRFEDQWAPDEQLKDEYGITVPNAVPFSLLVKNYIKRSYKEQHIVPDASPAKLISYFEENIPDRFTNFVRDLRFNQPIFYFRNGTDLTGKLIYHLDGANCHLLLFNQIPALIGKPIKMEYLRLDRRADRRTGEDNTVRKVVENYFKTIDQLLNIRARLKRLGDPPRRCYFNH